MMHVTVNEKRMYSLIDTLVARRKAGLHPYNLPNAVPPQALVPEEIRKDEKELSLFYFFACVYMRGGIQSHTVFKQLAKLRLEHPDFFRPALVAQMRDTDVSSTLKRYIGWDSKAAGRYWRGNAERLERNWGGNPLSIFRGVRHYEEAVRRFANKPQPSAWHKKNPNAGFLDGTHEGFLGHQEKMVSMQLYFADSAGWLKPRFIYPSPVDLHLYRLGISSGGIVVTMNNGKEIRYSEKISAQYRAILVRYMKSTGADPLIVADALWLYSLLMCGESPATRTISPKEPAWMFEKYGVQEVWEQGEWLNSRTRNDLLRTCGVCVLAETCEFAIPAQPYYRVGKIILRRRPKLPVNVVVDTLNSEVDGSGVEQPSLFDEPGG